MTRQDTLLKWAAYGVALVVITLLNYYVLALLPISLPLLLPVAAVAVGSLEGATFGAGFGIAAGLVMATAGHGGPACVAAVAAAGWLSGLLAQYVLRQDFWGHLLCACLTLLIWEGYHILRLLAEGAAPLGVLVRVALPELLWTLLFSIPVYWIGRFCCLHYGRIYHE